jgi:hypothetical protein
LPKQKKFCKPVAYIRYGFFFALASGFIVHEEPGGMEEKER